MTSRRIAIERISLMLGGALSPQITSGLMGQVLNDGPSVPVTDARRTLLAEIAETIVPTTDTPGAKAAGVTDFVVRVMRDCFALEEQETFYAGIEALDQAGREGEGKSFMDLDADRRAAVLSEFARKDRNLFRRLKELVVTGYCISEVGATQVLEYLPVPGRFEGDIPMEPGQKAWAISR